MLVHLSRVYLDMGPGSFPAAPAAFFLRCFFFLFRHRAKCPLAVVHRASIPSPGALVRIDARSRSTQ